MNFNAQQARKRAGDASDPPPPAPPSSSSDAASDAASERKRKRKSRWGGGDTDKTFIPGMPTMMPSGLSKEQEEAYLRECAFR